MLQIPLKKSTPCDLVTPICRFLSTEYSQGTSDEHLEEIRSLQTLRNGAVEQSDINGSVNLQIYHAQLLHIGSRLPVSTSSVNVSFTWHDAFLKGKQATQTNLAFERASVLFNLGALESYEGAAADRTSDDGLKKACKHFQAAAGYFDHIKNHMPEVATGMLTCDLTPSGSGLALQLMLGQAMACYYEMAVRKRAQTKIKPSLLAKLAMHTGLMYKKAVEFTQSPALKEQLDASWGVQVKFQHLSFEAAAQYWQSQHVAAAAKEVGKGYAEEITRIKMALRAANEAIAVSTANKLGNEQSLQDLVAKLNENLTVAVADNRTVYLEVEPDESSLTPIQGASPVKPSPPCLNLTQLKTAHAGRVEVDSAQPLLVNLLPVGALRAVEASKTRVQGYSDAKEVGKRATRDARQHLAAVGLPGSIAAQDDSVGLAENLWNRIKQAQELGGEWAIKSKLSELDQGAERAHELMQSVKTSLNDEKRQATMFMHSHPGVDIGAEDDEQFRKDLDHYVEIFRTARASDEAIRGEISSASFKNTLKLLSSSRSELDARYPRRDLLDDDSSIVKADTAKLSQELMAFAGMLKARDQSIAALSSTLDTYNEDIMSRVRQLADKGESLVTPLAGGGNTASEGLVNLLKEAENQIESLQQEVYASVASQTEAMERVLKENTIFEAARSTDAVAVGRQRMTAELEQSLSEFHDIHAKLSEGASFYSDLVGRLMQISQTVEGYIYAQGLMRRDVDLSYSSQSDKASVEASDAALARRLAEELQMGDMGETSSNSSSSNGYGSSNNGVVFGRVVPAAEGSSNAVSGTPVGSSDSLPPPPTTMASAPPPPFPTFGSSASPPPPSYGSAVAATPNNSQGAVGRLCDMGFSMDKVQAALKANNDDEERALDHLLSSS